MPTTTEAVEVFRQFAWNLAGKLVAPDSGRPRAAAALGAAQAGGETLMETIPIDADGRFSGYASVFGKADEGGDIVMPCAFRKSLGLRGKHRIKMLFQHDPKDPVGTWDAIREDGFGLWVEGRLVPEVPRAEALRRLIARRAVDGLSIGFRTVKSTREPRTGHRQLWEIDLWEVSIVTFPMMDLARIAPGQPPVSTRLERSLQAAMSVFRT